MEQSLVEPNLEQLNLKDGVGLMGLDNFLLSRIISYLDFKAYYSLCLTCKRLKEVAEDFYSWNCSVLFLRISHLIQNAWFEGWFEQEGKGFKKYPKCNLTSLMKEGLYLGQTLSALSLDNAKFIWKENGPVVFKLFSYLTRFTVEEIHNHPLSVWLIRRKSSTFKLPCGDLLIQVSIIESPDPEDVDDNDEEEDGDEEEEPEFEPEEKLEDKFPFKRIKIKGYLNGKCIVIYKTTMYDEPHTRVNTDTEDITISSDPMSLQPIIDVITKSLPKADMKLDLEFLVDLLLSFPFKVLTHSKKIQFINQEQNTQPRWDSFYEKLSEIRKECLDIYNANSKKITAMRVDNKDDLNELVLYLSVLLEKKSQYYKFVDACYHGSAKVGFDLLLANDQLIRCLLHRVDFLNSWCSFASSSKFESRIAMRMQGGDVLNIVSDWDSTKDIGMEPKMIISFKFSLNQKFLTEWKTDALTANVECYTGLDVITKILQDCVNCDLRNCDHEIVITDKVIGKFFLSLIKGLAKGITGLF